ncbi:hypothetical protein CDAR_591741 [Caerostris darwini]|uniref:Uncharacterized protein n=1 Tax=Caerostris darwini TaxID=1538125 RepID=A0AAV4PI51_9ARAC|nr:hypothetical protein CDAR_591741 [Caerostris darwini]
MDTMKMETESPSTPETLNPPALKRSSPPSIKALGKRIPTERYRRRNQVPESFRCCGFYHNSEAWHLPRRCVKCADNPDSKECNMESDQLLSVPTASVNWHERSLVSKMNSFPPMFVFKYKKHFFIKMNKWRQRRRSSFLRKKIKKVHFDMLT